MRKSIAAVLTRRGREMRPLKVLYLTAVMVMTIGLFGCGGGGGDGNPDPNPVSQSQADTIAGQITKGAVNAMVSGTSIKAVERESLVKSMERESIPENNTIDCESCGTNSPLIVSEKQVSQNMPMESKQVNSMSVTAAAPCVPVQLNINVNSRTTCTAGGYITVLGGLTGSINSCGTGIMQLQLIESIVDWRCVGGWVVNGDPYISLVATFTFLNGSPATRQDMTINGGFKWGTSAAESCQIHLNTNFDLNAGSSRTTGTICGRSVDLST